MCSLLKQRCCPISFPLHSPIHLYGLVPSLCNESRGAVRRSGTQREPCSVPGVFLCLGGDAGSLQDYTCPAVSATRGSGVMTPAGQGHGFHSSDHHLCLFSPAALRDRCKCSSNLDVLAETSPAALHLFIITPLLCLSSSSSSFRLVASRTGFIIPACSFLTAAILLEM